MVVIEEREHVVGEVGGSMVIAGRRLASRRRFTNRRLRVPHRVHDEALA